MDSVNGLHSALSLYSSTKIKDRVQGLQKVKDIFSNRENLLVFQAAAAKEGGAAWVAVFQCLFRVVSLEKSLVLKKETNAQAGRLSQAIQLVRLVAEQTVHLIARKPFMTLLTHMRQQLVFSSRIFAPALLDYSKAIRKLLTYPPHLESMDRHSWLSLMSICFSVILGDEVVPDDRMDEEDPLNVSMEIQRLEREEKAETPSYSHKPPISQENSDLVQIIPILLCSTQSPLLPPTLNNGDSLKPGQKNGLGILLKIRRFFAMYSQVTTYHLPLLKALNIVLVEMELNCRDMFVFASNKLFPHLVTLWAAPERDRDRRIPEQVAIAVKITFPYVTHKTLLDGNQSTVIRESVEKLIEVLPRETVMSRGLEPLDMQNLRLRTLMEEDITCQPFETLSFSAGFHFTAEQAFTWVCLEVYRDCFTYLHTQSSLHFSVSGRTSSASKRRKLESPVISLLSAASIGKPQSRLLALQCVIFIVDEHWNSLSPASQSEIYRLLLSALDDDNEMLQVWGFIGLSSVAVLVQAVSQSKTEVEKKESHVLNASLHPSTKDNIEIAWTKVWDHAMRKCDSMTVSRAACHAAATIIQIGVLDHAKLTKDVRIMLQSIDIQGPPSTHDSVCTLLAVALDKSKNEIQLYNLGLEDNVIVWLEKILTGQKYWSTDRAEQRMDQTTPAVLIRLFSMICGIRHYQLAQPSTKEFLPDSAVVKYILAEFKVKPIRDFMLYQSFPKLEKAMHKVDIVSMCSVTSASTNFLEGRPCRLSNILLDAIKALTAQWEANPVAGSGERPRRCLDMIVVSLSFQGLLQLNDYVPHTASILATVHLLGVIQSSLISSDLSLPSLDLVWRGLRPLTDSPLVDREEEDWPILIRPNVQSGIRQDVLLPDNYDLPQWQDGQNIGDSGFSVHKQKQSDQISPAFPLTFPSTFPSPDSTILPTSSVSPQSSSTIHLIGTIWRLPYVSSALKNIFELCLQIIDITCSSGTYEAQAEDILNDDHDNFVIGNTEASSMPLPKEAIETNYSTSLLQSAIAFRSKGAMLANGQLRAYKDTQMINSLLQLEGFRAIEFGLSICKAVRKGWIRVEVDAVDLVASFLGDMLNSYGYSKDEGALQLCLEWLRCTLVIWMEESHDLVDEAMRFVCYIASKLADGAIASWKVKLTFLTFLDDFLHYHSAPIVWTRSMSEDDDGSDANLNDKGVWQQIAGALVDYDMRVRMRAATIAATAFYRPALPAGEHPWFYLRTLDLQPGDETQFEVFLSHLLWKLNCCISSARQRPTIMFHLQEVAVTSVDYNLYLKTGFNAVVNRLGLSSISMLYLTYSPMISISHPDVLNLLGITHELYEFSSRKTFVSACVEYAGPYMLQCDKTDLFVSACDAAGLSAKKIVIEHFSRMAALSFAMNFATVVTEKQEMLNHFRDKVMLNRLATYPGIEAPEKADVLLQKTVNRVEAYMWELLDTKISFAGIVSFFNSSRGKRTTTEVFEDIIICDLSESEEIPALEPSASIESIFAACKYLQVNYVNSAPERVAFLTFIRLSDLINNALLVSEERRYLRSLASAMMMYQEELRDPVVLIALLQELLPMLLLPDICEMVLSMVFWAFRWVLSLKSTPKNLVDLFVRLGTITVQLSETPVAIDTLINVGKKLESWIVTTYPQWEESGICSGSLKKAIPAWPDVLRARLPGNPVTSFDDILDLAHSKSLADSAQLCKQLIYIAKNNEQHVSLAFQNSLFWLLKSKLGQQMENQGIEAFQDLLYLSGAQIRAPFLSDTNQAAMSKLHDSYFKDKGSYMSIIGQVTLLLNDSHHQIRAAAYRTLQGMKTAIIELGVDANLPGPVIDILDKFEPAHISFGIDRKGEIDLSELLKHSCRDQPQIPDSTWVLSFSKALCTVTSDSTNFYIMLGPLLSTPGISLQDFLPFLVHGALSCGASKRELLTRSKTIHDYLDSVLQSNPVTNETIQNILNVILYLRNHDPPYNKGPLGYNAWFDFDYLSLSSAAIQCGSYVTALLFLELARDQKEVELDNSIVRQNLYSIYSNLEDPDGFYGIQNHDIRDALRRRLQHESQAWKALGWAGAAFDNGNQNSFLPVLRNLYTIGFPHLASALIAKNQWTDESTHNDPLFSELGWRTGTWDIPLNEKASRTSSGLLYLALNAVYRARHPQEAMKTVIWATGIEMDRLRELPAEMMANIKETIDNLLCLREIKKWLNFQIQTNQKTSGSETGDVSFNEFQQMSEVIKFDIAERITATRLSLCRFIKQREQQDSIGEQLTHKSILAQNAERSCHINLCEMALQENNLQVAINSITALQSLDIGKENETQDFFCEVLWRQDEHALAIQLVQDLVNEAKGREPKDRRLPVLQGRLAHWTSKARLQPAMEIYPTFKNSVALAKSFKVDTQEHAKLCYQFACFAHEQHSIVLNSPELKRLKNHRDKRDAHLSQLPRKEIMEDNRSLEKLENSVKGYLNTALQSYAACLAMTDKFDDCIIKLVNLWLENDHDQDSNETFSHAAARVPSHKFIVLGPQLAARLHRTQDPSLFNSTLNRLVLRITRDHPYHILYQVITLAYGYEKSFKTSYGRGPAAAEIMALLRSSSGTKYTLASQAFSSMWKFVHNAINFTHSIKNEEKGKPGQRYGLSKRAAIRNAPNDIPIATRPPPIDVTCQYKDIVTFSHYEETYTLAGGLSKPFVVTCYDSKGAKCKQLFKKDEGFRQDAVMEQVFSLVNDLLNRDRQARSRNLRFRTYGVVALPFDVGVIEFVQGTKSIGEWLSHAHTKYCPNDMSVSEMRKALLSLQKERAPEIGVHFKELKNKFKPVMRHFFTEKHKDPVAWFSMRLEYGRSLAVTSIVGWVLGIGDRHCSNILIDQQSGELVHIDFGVAFEAGRFLPVPELVPFRLTDDLVDALGITGVNGTFRQCSQLVLQNLIDSSNVILTILEVFKLDPLHSWDASEKAKKKQGGSEQVNVDYGELPKGWEKADRILAKIREKLSKELSVHYRVNQLIQEARDPDHLGAIFTGESLISYQRLAQYAHLDTMQGGRHGSNCWAHYARHTLYLSYLTALA
nr:hypothetical protein L204_00175 [Cryptococcus depauperatus CBS 7855]